VINYDLAVKGLDRLQNLLEIDLGNLVLPVCCSRKFLACDGVYMEFNLPYIAFTMVVCFRLALGTTKGRMPCQAPAAAVCGFSPECLSALVFEAFHRKVLASGNRMHKLKYPSCRLSLYRPASSFDKSPLRASSHDPLRVVLTDEPLLAHLRRWLDFQRIKRIQKHVAEFATSLVVIGSNVKPQRQLYLCFVFLHIKRCCACSEFVIAPV